MLQVSDWMSKNIITCKKEDSVLNASKTMAKKGIGALVVVDDDKHPIGMITEKDMMVKIVSKEKDPKRTLVEKIMAKNILTADIGSSFLEVSRQMQKHHLRRVPITKDGKIVGIITSRDIVRVMSGSR